MADAAWNHAFRSSCLRVGFRIDLSRAMLELLCAVADDVLWDRFWTFRGGENAFALATGAALEKRGLIEDVRKNPDVFRERLREWSTPGLPGGKPDIRSWWKLTPAGEAIVSLVKMSGLFVEADQARERAIAQAMNEPVDA